MGRGLGRRHRAAFKSAQPCNQSVPELSSPLQSSLDFRNQRIFVAWIQAHQPAPGQEGPVAQIIFDLSLHERSTRRRSRRTAHHVLYSATSPRARQGGVYPDRKRRTRSTSTDGESRGPPGDVPKAPHRKGAAPAELHAREPACRSRSPHYPIVALVEAADVDPSLEISDSEPLCSLACSREAI